MLKIEHISKTFNPGTVNEKQAIKDLSLNLEKGDFATIIGSNGAGKSTLFNAICGDFLTDSGVIMLDGQDITFMPQHVRAKTIGRLYQDPMRGTAPGMTIEENLALAYSKNTKIISADGGFVFNAVCDSSTIVVPAEEGLKERLEAVLAETKLQEYKVTEESGQISIYAKGVPAHASTPTLGVNAIGVTFECLEKAGFKDDFVEFYNTHIGTSCDGEGIGLKFADEYGELTLCNGMIKTENDVISCTIDIRVPVTLKSDEVRRMCEGRLEDENGRIEILGIGDALFFPRESPLVNALYKAYTDVTGDTENKPMVIGGGTYAKSLKNIIAFGPEKPGIDYRIHSADEFILVSGMEEAVLVYMEAIKNLLAI